MTIVYNQIHKSVTCSLEVARMPMFQGSGRFRGGDGRTEPLCTKVWIGRTRTTTKLPNTKGVNLG